MEKMQMVVKKRGLEYLRCGKDLGRIPDSWDLVR
jgi:hypothetical protein